MKAERISTEREGKWNGQYPVLMVHKIGTPDEMIVLFISTGRGVTVTGTIDSADYTIGHFTDTWADAGDSMWTYLPETDVIVLSNKEEED